ncbi:MAG: S8 family serine peptidase [Gemmatimonadota bacterium]|nr:S8 family serine peptidase [Gemmatimonadota bacterium]
MRPFRFLLVLLALVALAAACGDGTAPVDPAGSTELATATSPEADRYLVIFESGVDDATSLARRLAASRGATLRTVYRHAVKGFAAEIPAAALAGLQAHPAVAYVEADQKVYAVGQTVPTGIARIFADDNLEIGIDGVDDVRVDADIAIIDTGIAAHSDLNIAGGTDCSSILISFGYPCADGTFDDGNGHGTHVAGSAGAIDNGLGVVGVAPGARLWGVKALGDDGSGYISSIVAAIDWVTARADQIEVANMSFGCTCESTAMDDAIAASVAAGVAYAAAAGNDSVDAADFNPANHPDVITVSALADFDGEPGGLASYTCREDLDDTLAAFSNFGSLVEIVAPGVCIESTYLNDGYATGSGTSMASPHVAGAAALLAASGTTDPATIRSTLVSTGNLDWTDDSGDGIQEPLLDVSDATVFDPATVAGGGDSGGSDSDTSTGDPPNVEISNPSEGEVMSGTDEIRVAATDLEDAFGTLFIEVRVDGGTWHEAVFESDFYRWTWDTTVHADGEVVVEARGTDSDGNVTDATPVTAMIDNGSTTDDPPTATITSPADGASVTGIVTVQVDATDAEDAAGTLSVDVRIGSGGSWQPAAWNSTTSRYELDWDTSATADGTSVAIDARATDSASNTANAATVTVTVDHPDATPSSIHVAGLSGVSVNEGRTWHADVTIEVADDLGNPVSDVTVQGGWVSGTIGLTECVTDATGACTVSSPSVRKFISSITWALDGLSHATLAHDSSADVATSITVEK